MLLETFLSKETMTPEVVPSDQPIRSPKNLSEQERIQARLNTARGVKGWADCEKQRKEWELAQSTNPIGGELGPVPPSPDSTWTH